MTLSLSQLHKRVVWITREHTGYLDSLSDNEFRLKPITAKILVNATVENYHKLRS